MMLKPIQRTRWHRIFATFLKELLTPVKIGVLSDAQVLTEPPEADILLLRQNESGCWTPEQRERLPDGIRDSSCSDILLEFKYTESINRRAFLQILVYDTLYKESQKKRNRQVQSFLISSRSVRQKTLDHFEYFPTEIKGVYRSENTLLKPISLILLNQLEDTESRPPREMQPLNALPAAGKRSSEDFHI